METKNLGTAPQEYTIGKHIFIVNPMYKSEAETTDTIADIILKIIKNDIENDRF